MGASGAPDAVRVGVYSVKPLPRPGDPLDICVISERPLTRAEVILTARVVGGILAVDGGEAGDKIVGVLDNDEFWRDVEDVSQVPDILIERLRHYFMQKFDRTW